MAQRPGVSCKGSVEPGVAQSGGGSGISFAVRIGEVSYGGTGGGSELFATPPIGWDPWVLNAASYISVVKTGTMLGSRFALAVVVGSAGRVRW